MNAIDLTPIFGSHVGFDRFAPWFDRALNVDADTVSARNPAYNIEVVEEDHFVISLAVAGFQQNELEISVENNQLTIKGIKDVDTKRKYLHQGIANAPFERHFNLAEHIEVMGADLNNGLLTVNLVRQIPEAMKPRTIAINKDSSVIKHKSVEGGKAA